MMLIQVKAICPDEFNELIEFDKQHLVDVMKQIGIDARKASPPFTQEELLALPQKGALPQIKGHFNRS